MDNKANLPDKLHTGHDEMTSTVAYLVTGKDGAKDSWLSVKYWREKNYKYSFGEKVRG